MHLLGMSHHVVFASEELEADRARYLRSHAMVCAQKVTAKVANVSVSLAADVTAVGIV